MRDEDIAIKVENLHKTFKLPHEKQSSLKSALINFRGRKKGHEKFHVLKGISFDIKKGEFFGIVGRNGSGKSTLLKLLAGIYTPDDGSIVVHGTLAPFIELGVGFNPELTGRENVFLNGALLGFSRKEMTEMYDGIVEFAELSRFMDQKLKNYSSGMQVRLAFAIAIQAKAQILLLDEVLAVGDANFQKKCFDYFEKVKNEKKTVILVTHDMDITRKYCSKAILLDAGKIVSSGDSEKVAKHYKGIMAEYASQERDDVNRRKLANTERPLAAKATVTRIWTEDEVGNAVSVFEPEQTVTIKARIEAVVDADDVSLTIRCKNPGGPPLFSMDSKIENKRIDLKKGMSAEIHWSFKNMFNDGSYLVGCTLYHDNKSTVAGKLDEIYNFEVRGWPSPHVMVHVPGNQQSVAVHLTS